MWASTSTAAAIAADDVLENALERLGGIVREDDVKHQSNVHAWEGAIDRTWDSIEEDSAGMLKSTLLQTAIQRKVRLDEQLSAAQDASGAVVEKGLIRNVVFVLDRSHAMVDDATGARRVVLNPYGQRAVMEQVEGFVKVGFARERGSGSSEGSCDFPFPRSPHQSSPSSLICPPLPQSYFDQNPVSQLSILTSHSGKAEKISDLTCTHTRSLCLHRTPPLASRAVTSFPCFSPFRASPLSHTSRSHPLLSLSSPHPHAHPAANPVRQLQALRDSYASGGDFSLQNSLSVAGKKLIASTAFGTREIVILQAALSSVDPGDVFQTIAYVFLTAVRI